MLVLTRKTDQSITLSPRSEAFPKGGDLTSTEAAIEVTVLEIRGDQVRLGIRAPHDVAVHRKEVWMQVREENRAAAASCSHGGTVACKD